MIECTIPALLAVIGMLAPAANGITFIDMASYQEIVADVVAACEEETVDLSVYEPEFLPDIDELGGPKAWSYPLND